VVKVNHIEHLRQGQSRSCRPTLPWRLVTRFRARRTYGSAKRCFQPLCECKSWSAQEWRESKEVRAILLLEPLGEWSDFAARAMPEGAVPEKWHLAPDGTALSATRELAASPICSSRPLKPAQWRSHSARSCTAVSVSVACRRVEHCEPGAAHWPPPRRRARSAG
jgi:hypothetical protein